MSIIKAKAIAFTRPMHAELCSNISLPKMDEDGVLVRTEYSTISRGTELDLYTGQMHGRGMDTQWYPMLPGYMPVGIVEAVGKNIQHLRVGDRIVGSNLFKGFDRRYCPAWAGHTQYVVISKASHPQLGGLRAVKVPEGIAPDQAGLAMLAGVAWHGVKEKVKPKPGDQVLVIGQGVIGIFAAQLCKAHGARVIVADQYENRLGFSQQNGLADTIQCEKGCLVKAYLDYTSGERPNAVIEVTGEQEPLLQALELVRPYGSVHAQGMYLEAAPPNILRILFNKNLTLSCTVGETPELTQESLAMMATGKITTKGLISEVSEPSQAGDVYEAVYHHPDRYMTCAFKWY
jgi:2-desacetyl-2-hydroxyethyl bacteriochlorophyllide A dehydrogenase